MQEFPLARIKKIMRMDEDVRVSTSNTHTHTYTHARTTHTNVHETIPHVIQFAYVQSCIIHSRL